MQMQLRALARPAPSAQRLALAIEFPLGSPSRKLASEPKLFYLAHSATLMQPLDHARGHKGVRKGRLLGPLTCGLLASIGAFSFSRSALLSYNDYNYHYNRHYDKHPALRCWRPQAGC